MLAGIAEVSYVFSFSESVSHKYRHSTTMKTQQGWNLSGTSFTQPYKYFLWFLILKTKFKYQNNPQVQGKLRSSYIEFGVNLGSLLTVSSGGYLRGGIICKVT